MKKVILIDLDGVLNSYMGNYDENYIPPVRNDAYNFLKYLAQDYSIKIFTTRNLFIVSKWVLENKIEEFIDGVTNIKELNYLIIDDRCINFDGDYSNLKKQIKNFKVWYKKE